MFGPPGMVGNKGEPPGVPRIEGYNTPIGATPVAMSRHLFALLLLLSLPLQAAELSAVRLPQATDLQALGDQARARGLPLLVMFSSAHCPYCMIVREEFLKPMLRSGDYADKVIMAEVEADETPITDFDGHTRSALDVAQRYDATLSPTVVFLDPDGHELAPRLVGITTVDFYGGYLDEAIEQARTRLRKLAFRGTAR